MGSRRTRLIHDFFTDIEVCGTDGNPERRLNAAEKFGIPCFDSIERAAAEFTPDCALVCTSPLSHADIITELLTLGMSVFTEINLISTGYARNTALAGERGLALFLSSTPIYRRETRYIADRVRDAGCPLLYRYHVGQYLPDWHPWENYKDFFVGDRRTNGCREIFAIELPWLERAFGKIERAESHARKLTSLAVDFPDTYIVTLFHEGGAVGSLAVDVVSRKPVRDLEVVGEQLYLHWGGAPDSLYNYDYSNKEDKKIDTYDSVEQDKRYASNIIENAYVDELSAFFDTLAGKPALAHSFEDDERLLAIIDGIEGAGEE